MLVLFETSLGFCLFKLADNGKLDAEVHKHFDTPEGASNLLKLKSIHRFASTADAVEDMTAIGEGKLSKNLKKFLLDEISEKKRAKETLAVSDTKLAGAIAKKLGIKVVADATTSDLFRGIRTQLASLLGDFNVDEADLNTMNLGLSHSLSRFKLKFSPDKVDTMIVQAIALLDDLDKEINTYAMRVKEWYGWHFPEMAKVITDNLAYSKIVKAMGFRTNYATTDFSAILPEELEETLKAIAAVSMGTEISDTDLSHIQQLATQVIDMMGYRAELYEYLRNRMVAIAPNLTFLLGELVGARLISHTGNLMSLAKAPASTIQILGAEKALFRALKTKHDTPKYGLIFHSSLVGQAPGKLKGKMARMAAAKAALCVRHDALADADTKSTEDAAAIGTAARIKLEARLRQLEQALGLSSVRTRDKGERTNQKPFLKLPTTGAYNTAADDVLIPTAAAASDGPALMEVDGGAETSVRKEKKSKKDKKEKGKTKVLIEEIDGAADREIERAAEAAAEDRMDEVADAAADANGIDEAEAKRKRKEEKRARKAAAKAAAVTAAAPAPATTNGSTVHATDVPIPDPSTADSPKKSKKRKSEAGLEPAAPEQAAVVVGEAEGEGKKKKKKKQKLDA